MAMAVSTFAINAKAQTKEETIKWISEKISSCALRSWNNIDCTFTNSYEHYFMSTNAIINLDMVKIILKARYPKDYNPVWKQEMYEANINNLINAEVCNECSFCSTRPIRLYFKPKSVSLTNDDSNGKSSYNLDNQVDLYLDWAAEPNLRNRMLTALTHLIELNENKQTF